MVSSIHAGYRAPPWSKSWPAHLHIDLLPVAQGLGHGPRLINAFVDRLRAMAVPGLHLGVSKGNKRAVAFYPRVGFEVVKESSDNLVYGMRL